MIYFRIWCPLILYRGASQNRSGWVWVWARSSRHWHIPGLWPPLVRMPPELLRLTIYWKCSWGYMATHTQLYFALPYWEHSTTDSSNSSWHGKISPFLSFTWKTLEQSSVKCLSRKGACHRAYWPKFNPQNLQGRRWQSACASCLLTSISAP